MLLRIVRKALWRRKGRLAPAVAALFLGAALLSSLMTVVLDAGTRASTELSAYGPNLLLASHAPLLRVSAGSQEAGSLASSASLPEDYLAILEDERGAGDLSDYAPWLYSVVVLQGERVVLGGTWPDSARPLHPWWQVDGSWIESREDTEGALLGVTLAERLGIKPGDSISVESGGATFTLKVRGIVQSGGSEDRQVLTALKAAQEITGRRGVVDLVLARAPLQGRRLQALAQQLQEGLPDMDARVLGQIARAESQVLGKVQLLLGLVTGFVLGASALVVFSTMTATVLERTPEVGLMKALGATRGRVALIFFLEALAVGTAGGALGYVAGLPLAQLIEWRVFDSSISWHVLPLPVTLLSSLAVALLASGLPIRRALGIEPAVTMKGE